MRKGQFNLPENSSILISWFDRDIRRALKDVHRQIDAIPNSQLAMPAIEKTFAKAVTTIEAMNKQAQRNQRRNRNARR